MYDGHRYFETAKEGRGIFVRRPLRVIAAEEILEKLAEIYDLLKGRRGHSHFIDRATFEDLQFKHEQLRAEYEEKEEECSNMECELGLLQQQIELMKGTLQSKIQETGSLAS